MSTDCAEYFSIKQPANHCVEELRQLVSEDSKLKNCRKEDAYLLRFLHCSGFNVALAFKRMQDYRDLMLEYPDWFSVISPLAKKRQIEQNDKIVLKIRDKHGRSVWLLKLGNVDVVNTSPTEQSHIFDMLLESILDDPKTQAAGVSVIVDMDGYSWRLFKWLTPLNIKVATRKVDLNPIKELLLHVVNTSFLFSASLKLIWPFLNDRLKNMIKLHFDDWSSLHEFISPEDLPAEYGGTGPDIDVEKSNQQLFDHSSEIAAKLKQNLALRN